MRPRLKVCDAHSVSYQVSMFKQLFVCTRQLICKEKVSIERFNETLYFKISFTD